MVDSGNPGSSRNPAISRRSLGASWDAPPSARSTRRRAIRVAGATAAGALLAPNYVKPALRPLVIPRALAISPGGETPTPTPEVALTRTPTPTSDVNLTSTPTVTPTPTISATPTASPTSTATSTPTSTAPSGVAQESTPTSSPTKTPTVQPTAPLPTPIGSPVGPLLAPPGGPVGTATTVPAMVPGAPSAPEDVPPSIQGLMPRAGGIAALTLLTAGAIAVGTGNTMRRLRGRIDQATVRKDGDGH